MSEDLVHKKLFSCFGLLTVNDEAYYPSAAMYSSEICSRREEWYVNEAVVVYLNILGI